MHGIFSTVHLLSDTVCSSVIKRIQRLLLHFALSTTTPSYYSFKGLTVLYPDLQIKPIEFQFFVTLTHFTRLLDPLTPKDHSNSLGDDPYILTGNLKESNSRLLISEKISGNSGNTLEDMGNAVCN
jgi:hypothetical protein